jgi:divalent metal cation (Fe/Co/Zn/Cd) transporter
VNTASAVFHLRAGIPVFCLFLGAAIILFSAWMGVREAAFGIRSRTCKPWAWAGFAVFSIAALLAVAGLNLRLADYAGIPALIFMAAMALADRRDPMRYSKRAAARNRRA